MPCSGVEQLIPTTAAACSMAARGSVAVSCVLAGARSDVSA